MSGGFDLTVIIKGKSMREVVSFVSDKLAPLEAVLSTSTNFVLKKYKENGMDYVNDLLGGVQQYGSDNLTEKDAEDIFNHYYNGVSPEGELDYSEIAINTPEGNYFTSNI